MKSAGGGRGFVTNYFFRVKWIIKSAELLSHNFEFCLIWLKNMKWKNRPATAFLRIKDSAWIAYKMKIQRKKSYNGNSTSYLWVKWNTSFEKRIHRGYCNDFLRYGNVAHTYKVCFWLKMIFSNAVLFVWKLSFSVYIDFRQSP